MKTRIPTHLTDSQLIEEVKRHARGERGATALLVAHLAEMDARQLHLGLGFSSLFAYCLEVLRLSESATCKRIEVARAARRLPVVLDRLAHGSLSLSTLNRLARHLTSENHLELMAAATGLSTRAVDELVARRFPKPDVSALVRKLPTPQPHAFPTVAQILHTMTTQATVAPSVQPDVAPLSAPAAPPVTHTVPPSPPTRPLMTPLSADRYQIRFTASAATWKKLRVAQDLLRHALPSGDPAEIFDRALTALIEDLAQKKCASVKAPAKRARTTAPGSRHVPAKVRRVVWVRDQGRCAFVADSGRRCQERGFLEFHHVDPHGVGGPTTVVNIQLRCGAHNKYESVLFYGPSKAFRREGVVRERAATYGLSPRHSTVHADGCGAARRGNAS